MKRIIAIFLAAAAFSISRAEVSLVVIYPKPDQEIPSVDSTFIFGHATIGVHLQINGTDVRIHKGGGWLAYLPVSRGPFVFHLTGARGKDTAFVDLPVQIGPVDSLGTQKPLIPKALISEEEMIYSVGSVFEFSFEAPPGGAGWFRISESDSVRMFESSRTEQSYWGDVFGESSYDYSKAADYVVYTGNYRIAAADTGRHCIYYRFQPLSEGQGYVNPLRSAYLNTDSVLTVIPEFPSLVGVLSGRSQIVRTGPGLGYKLLYQPPGIKVHIRAMRDGFYEISLADDVNGYVNIDSVTLLPPGASVPTGVISFISVDGSKDGIVISAPAGEKFPYEIDESGSPSRLDIDLFGVTGDVDWIRYNNAEDFKCLVTWSQPGDHLFRISVEFGDEEIGGYKPYYDGGDFKLEVYKKSKSNEFFYTSLKGLKIMIDPGHSHDSGAVGPTGFPEKDANLWIAHELRLMLERAGAEVMMTRYGHENVPLYNRPSMAEKWGADLLISIHNNALPDGINPFDHNGTSVYYYHPHSKPLAEAIHKHLVKATRLPDHGLYYGNLVLTRPSAMPAVLVECAFMIIPEQEAMLKTDKFQRKCAKAILEGIKEYIGR